MKLKTLVTLIAAPLVIAACKAQDPDVMPQQTPPAVQYAQAPAPSAPPPAPAPPPPEEAKEPPPAPPPPPPPPVKPPPPPAPVLIFPAIDRAAAVVFEDRFPRTGDEDFNDFMTEFRIVEKINSSNQITDIIVDFYPRAVGASYDHSFLIVLNGVKQQPSNIKLHTKPLFIGNANVKLTHYDQNLRVTDIQDHLPVDRDVTIFSSTHACFDPGNLNMPINTMMNNAYVPARQIARLEIHLWEPEKNVVSAKAKVDVSQFRMILHVKPGKRNGAEDIDIIDVDPNNFDKAGYPYGFVIPAEWRWPQESVNIDNAYSMFKDYRQYLIKRAAQPDLVPENDAVKFWYKLPGQEKYLYKAVPKPTLLPNP